MGFVQILVTKLLNLVTLSKDLLQRLDVARGEGDTDAVNGGLLSRGFLVFVGGLKGKEKYN